LVDVLAIGAHPDDIELRIGSTLAGLTRRGRSVAITHLTRGELSTRGTPEARAQEAAAAAEELGATSMEILDLGDGRLRDTTENRNAIIDAIRRLSPRLLLSPYPTDEHPDHGVAGALTKAAWYLAGIRKAGSPDLAPHRPEQIWFYPGHAVPEIQLVVACTREDVDAKRRALACYRSQFHNPDSAEPETRISSPSFLAEGEARMVHFGSLIGAPFGEPFHLQGPLGVSDVARLLDETPSA